MIGEVSNIKIDDWVVNVREPEGEGRPPVILMLHGWTGDENSMWVFASRLPSDVLLIAPRAPFEIESNQYRGHSWIDHANGAWSWLDEYRSSVTALDALLDSLSSRFEGDFSKIGLMGFSQGAAMSYAYTLLHPERISKVAALAGFVPERCEEVAAGRPIEGIEVLIAHGSRDEIVPVDRAEEAVKMMQMAGGKVEYCLSDSGHKLGANCFNALKTFFG